MQIYSVSMFRSFPLHFGRKEETPDIQKNSTQKTTNTETPFIDTQTVLNMTQKKGERIMKKSIKDLGDIEGKRALVRVDINVPLDADKNVTDDTRIQAILPTINYFKDKGPKIILMAHLGRPKGEWNPEFSLEPVAKYMSDMLGEEVLFVAAPVGKGAEKKLENLKDGQIALLENIRFYKAEEAKDDDMTFANELA